MPKTESELRKAATAIVEGYERGQRYLPLAGGIPQPISECTDNAVVLAVAWLAEHPESVKPVGEHKRTYDPYHPMGEAHG